MKYLIWAVVIYVAWRWYLVSKQKAAARPADAREADTAAAPPPANGAAEKMVGCAHCGILLPTSEALAGADQRLYCSEEHRALHVAS